MSEKMYTDIGMLSIIHRRKWLGCQKCRLVFYHKVIMLRISLEIILQKVGNKSQHKSLILKSLNLS